jgi:hypothetical protein
MLIVTLKLMACKRSQSDLRVLACPLSRVLVGRKLEKIGVFSTVGEPHFDRTPSDTDKRVPAPPGVFLPISAHTVSKRNGSESRVTCEACSIGRSHAGPCRARCRTHELFHY